jgi:succinate dehydrogenase / fumarate reductase membrane anchor subunit
MAERYSSFKSGTTLWFLQRVTAAILVVTLMFHFFWLHFVNHAADITFAGTEYRMEQLGYLITLLVFLVAAAFHGINGVYNALINQGITGTPKRALKWVLVVAGVVLVLQGFRVAAAMSGGGLL